MSFLTDSNDNKYANSTISLDSWNPANIDSKACSMDRYSDAKRLLANTGGRLLDYACGHGKMSLALESIFDELVGVDISTTALDQAKGITNELAENPDKIHFEPVPEDGKLPFQEKSFDAAVAACCLEHVIDPFFSLRQIHRVLKDGGKLFVALPNLGFLYFRLQLFIGKLPATAWGPGTMVDWERLGWDSGHLHCFTRKTIEQLLKHTGFQPIKWSGDGRFAKYRRWWPSLLCANINVLAEKL